MALPKVVPSGGTPTSTDFVSLQTQWTRQIDPIIEGVNSEHDMVGVVLQWAPASVPTKFLLCSGQTVLQTQYPLLFRAIGTLYNTGGEPAGSFRLPAAGSPIPLIIRYLPWGEQ